MIKLDMGIKFLVIKIIYLCFSVLVMGCINKNSIKISELEPYDKEFLNELKKEYSVGDINEYNEAYRLYKLPALRRPEILTVFKVEDNWIFSHTKIDRIIGAVTLFENNDIEIIYDTSNYNLKNDMINNFLRGMNNLWEPLKTLAKK